MAKFAAILTYGGDADQRQAVRPSHRDYLWSLANAGQLLHAGPFTDDSGSLLIYEAGSLEEAHDLMNADPFTVEGVFATTEIKGWTQVAPAL